MNTFSQIGSRGVYSSGRNNWHRFGGYALRTRRKKDCQKRGLRISVHEQRGVHFWAKKCDGKCAKSHGKREMCKGSAI